MLHAGALNIIWNSLQHLILSYFYIGDKSNIIAIEYEGKQSNIIGIKQHCFFAHTEKRTRPIEKTQIEVD